MDDKELLYLFENRSERAITMLSRTYEVMCRKIARNILHCHEDEEECINDSFLAFWNSVPPNKPNPVKAYLIKLVRNQCLKRYHSNHAEKRDSTYDLVLDEIGELVSTEDTLEERIIAKELTEHINLFLEKQDEINRGLFVCRYFHSESIKEIALKFGMKENSVPVKLLRIREKLKAFLEEKEMMI